MAPKPPRKPETVAEAAYEADLARLERDRVELKERIDAALEAENWELLDRLNDDFDNLPQTVEELRDRQVKAKAERAAARKAAEDAAAAKEKEEKRLAAEEAAREKAEFKARIQSLAGRRERNQEASAVEYRDNLDKDKRLTRVKQRDEEAMFYAALAGDSALIETLARRETNVNAAVDGGFTPAFAAAEMGHLHVLELLNRLGANLSKVDDRGQTPLSMALFRKHQPCIDFLRFQDAKNVAVGAVDNVTIVSRPGSRGSPTKVRPVSRE